jgi:hypothetical protein
MRDVMNKCKNQKKICIIITQKILDKFQPIFSAMNKKDKLVAKKHRKAIARMKAKKKAALEQAQTEQAQSKKKSK